jgi:hypothetical protein
MTDKCVISSLEDILGVETVFVRRDLSLQNTSTYSKPLIKLDCTCRVKNERCKRDLERVDSA